MKPGFQQLVCLGLPFLLYACGSDTPSFVERPEAIITLAVDKNAVDEDSFDMDELMAEDLLSADSNSAVDIYAGGFGEEGTSDKDAVISDSGEASKGRGRGQNTKNTATVASSRSADATSTTSTADAGSTMGTVPSNGSTAATGSSTLPADSGYDAKAIAKACLPHFRGLSQKIKVVDASAPAQLNVAPDTVIAFKLTGNYSKLSINLPAGNDLPGVCFFVSGNHSEVKFSTASQMASFAYIAAGNQSSGAIEFLGGSPVSSHIDMKGNEAALNIQGLDAELCQLAKLNGNAPRLQCNP